MPCRSMRLAGTFLAAGGVVGAGALKTEATTAAETFSADVAAGGRFGFLAAMQKHVGKQVHRSGDLNAASGANALSFLSSMLANSAVGKKALGTPEDCKKTPRLCGAPFNCGNYTTKQRAEDTLRQTTKGAAVNGHANLQQWCLPNSQLYESYVAQCLIDKDLVRAANTQHYYTKNGVFGKHTYEIDASYCFLEGHCLNTQVTNQTTLEEAEKMCDDEYGHERWTMFGSFAPPNDMAAIPIAAMIAESPDQVGGQVGHYTNREQAEPYAIAACAMGNYHCDVMYCKETYCKDPYFVSKFGHYLKYFGWEDKWNNKL